MIARFRGRRSLWVSLAFSVLLGALMACASPEQRLVRSLASQGLWREAAARIRAELERQPTSAALHNDLGVCLEALGEREQAIGEYQRAAELAPADEVIRANLEAARRVLRSPQPGPSAP
jgi:Flp pilus assembly protein TadD